MPKIKIYTSNTCSHCSAAKEYLKEKELSYEERNVSTDPSAKKELIGMGYMGVPIIMVDDDVIEGFNKNKLDEIL
ncbi:glutaredoxin-like YruB-family protein [Sedimentibacter acidaminivorans]|jgi:glutaredoxin 3|uniref:Glutaredoxin-like YruB-family protein n=1 Tax=Sedimentibacter acidaminivorans TaxID=913099 RepID=A0ABS4GH68_9FIRM|nr:glutaredoxin family protein [Sedimentibacter acidaminivorans]MBP1926994.1 glutaredoxin-like YruB-family protein [Sedimentibacter acidaminivorans]